MLNITIPHFVHGKMEFMEGNELKGERKVHSI